MNIQSLSVCVPAGCPNNCKFCVAKMHQEPYENQIEKNRRFRDLYKTDFMERLQFCRDNGCNVAILTGNGEPLANINFLDDFAEWNKQIKNPFHWIEIQTSGVTLDEEKLRYLRNTVRVSTISLSISSFDNEINKNYNGTPENLTVDITKLCAMIKKYDFNLRLSLNMTDSFEDVIHSDWCQYNPNHIFDKCKELGVNQITFRKFYDSGLNTEQDKWIQKHKASDTCFEEINKHIKKNGRELEVLPFGAIRYSVNGMSVVVDDDCMNSEVKKDIKYMVLRPNCKLYTKWDDEGSIMF